MRVDSLSTCEHAPSIISVFGVWHHKRLPRPALRRLSLAILSKASDILEASIEAGLTLREVEDVVFSNTRTLEFFNSADLKQV